MDGPTLLKKTIEKCAGGAAEVAAVVGVSENLVWRWVTSSDAKHKRYPSLRNARAMELAFGIPMRSWVAQMQLAEQTITVSRVVGK